MTRRRRSSPRKARSKGRRARARLRSSKNKTRKPSSLLYRGGNSSAAVRTLSRSVLFRRHPTKFVTATLTKRVPLRMDPTFKEKWNLDYEVPLPVGRVVSINVSVPRTDEHGYPMWHVYDEKSRAAGWIYKKNLKIESFLPKLQTQGSKVTILELGNDEDGIRMVKVKNEETDTTGWTYFKNLDADDLCPICFWRILVGTLCLQLDVDTSFISHVCLKHGTQVSISVQRVASPSILDA